MRFQVPQFIEVEDKIFGPLTFKQFIYLMGGAGLSVILLLFLPRYIAVVFIAIVMGFSCVLAFYRINNRPFVVFLESAFYYLFNPKLYIWKKENPAPTLANIQEQATTPISSTAFIPKLNNSKLKDLTWSLDTRESLNPATKNDGTTAG